MKTYSLNEIKKSLDRVGLKKGDLIYVNPEFFRLGKLKEAKNKSYYFKIFFDLISNKIGKTGTIVSNSYSFQTLRYNKSFVFEKTPCSSGNWSEYVRKLKGSIRSHHPVFSVVAIGKLKNKICKRNSLNNYGKDSPYDYFLKNNGKILNIGMNPELNPFRHVVEFNHGVPYCYNKLTKINYYKKNKKINRIFSSFVQYESLKISDKEKSVTNKRIRNFITKDIKIKKSNLGSGKIYLYSANQYCKSLSKILNKDILGVFGNKKNFKKGEFPFK